MTGRVVAVVLMMALNGFSCAVDVDPRSSPGGLADHRVDEIWRGQMSVVDEYLALRDPKSGQKEARNSPDDLAHAIEFFEHLTGIRTKAPFTIIGPLPTKALVVSRKQWQAWYAQHGRELFYDDSDQQVKVKLGRDVR